jgi:hypothetical protein
MPKVEKLIKSASSISKVRKLAQRVKSIQAKHTKTYPPATLLTVSKTPIPQHPTKLNHIHAPIIQPGNVNIPDMEPIEVQPNIIQFQTKPTPPTKSTHPAKTTIPPTDNSYIIVIPTYNRPDTIQVKTLALLHRHKINPQNIVLFVANQEQYDLYKAKVPAFLYGSMVIGVIGLKNQRNFIMDYYPEGQQIVQMDDDLDKIVELVVSRKSKITRRRSSTRKTVKPIEDLDGFIKRAFNICKERGIYLWGVYPLSNSRFMTPKMTTDLRFIVGPMWGIINRHRPDLKLTIDEKENAERTLQHWVIDHAVLRFNNIGIETRYYTNKGGMQNEGKNRKEEALKSVYYLHQKYPNLTKIYLGKKSGVPEIRLKSY